MSRDDFPPFDKGSGPAESRRSAARGSRSRTANAGAAREGSGESVARGDRIRRPPEGGSHQLTIFSLEARGLDRLDSEFLSQVFGQGRPRVSALRRSSGRPEPGRGARRDQTMRPSEAEPLGSEAQPR
jgi:hypothetical protein